jgi:hypothetical protein
MSAYPTYRQRNLLSRTFAGADDFMSWLLHGYETWLVAVLKGVPFFLFMYFVIFYIPNYLYYLVTVEIPFLRFSDDVGFLVANGVGMGNLALVVVVGILVQAGRGRRGFGWSAIRIFVGLNYLLTVLLIIPGMAFNLAGGSLWPPRFPLQAIGFGVIVAGLGAMACVYLWFEYRRITGRERLEATERSTALARR